MENLIRNDNIAYRAIQRSRPGPSSWLALLLFVGSLVLAFELRDKIIEQIEYRELFANAAVLTLISKATLGFAIVLAVTGAFMAWRMWWTLSLIGTTTLGMPDVAAIGVGKLRAGTGRTAGAGASLARNCLRELGQATVGAIGFLRFMAARHVSLLLGGIARMGNRLRAAVVLVLFVLWNCLTLAGGPFHAVGAFFFRYSLVALDLTLKRIWLVVRATSLVMWLGVELLARYLWLVVSVASVYVWRCVELLAKYLWLAVSVSSMSVWRGVELVAKYLWLVASVSSMSAWRGVELVARYLWLVVSVASMSGWRGAVFVARCMWLIVSVSSMSGWRGAVFVARYMGLIVSVSFMSGWPGVVFIAKYLGLAVLAPFGLLIIGITISSKFVWNRASMLWPILKRAGSAVGKPVVMMIANEFRQLGNRLVSAGNGAWLAASAVSALLGRWVAREIRTLWSGAFWLSLTLKRGGTTLRKPVAAAAVISVRRLGSFLSLAGNFVLSATCAVLALLGRCVTGVIEGVSNGAYRFWLTLRNIGVAASKPVLTATVILSRELMSVLIFSGNGVWLAISVASSLVAKGTVRSISNIGYGIYRLCLILRHVGAAAGGPIMDALTNLVRSQGRSLRDLDRYLRPAMSTVGHDLQVILVSAGRSSRTALNAVLKCTGRILKSGISNLVTAMPILVLSPLLALRLILDQAYRREVAARSRILFAAIWARRAVGLAGLGTALIIGLAAFTARETVWPSQPPVEVIIWTWGEKNNVLLPSLKRFNELGLTVTVDGRRYQVQARPVSVDPTEMHAALVAKINDGTDFPEWLLGAPTVISPDESGLLDQVNRGIEEEVFPLDQVRPIVRTPIVILTYRGMAECLGWPERPIGWIDIITLAENPEGWSVCPTAQPEWGEKPLVAFAGPEGSSLGGSVRQILHIIETGKAAEGLTPADVEDPGVRTLPDRFQAIVDRYYTEAREFQTAIRKGPGFVQFAPVEEYTIARLYQDWADAGAAPGYDVVAIYPEEGTLWNDNPFAIPNVPWVNEVQREAAHLVEEYLRSREVQDRFMESGFRPGIYVEPGELLIPTQGLDLKQPAVILGRVLAEVLGPSCYRGCSLE